VLFIPERGGARPVRTTFQLTGNAEELAVQLDYLARESGTMLERLGGPVRGPESWLGRSIEALSAEPAQAAIRREYEQRIEQWRVLGDDLRRLGAFKQRLATFRLLQRMAEVARKLRKRLAAAEQHLAESTARISTIVGKSNTDIETDRLHIPNRYAREYPQQLQRRDQAKQEIAELRRRMESAASEIRARVGRLELRGTSSPPVLAMLTGMPTSWAKLERQISDGAIKARLAELEGPLEMPLMPPDWADEAAATGRKPA
jgi:hypothetical protein